MTFLDLAAADPRRAGGRRPHPTPHPRRARRPGAPARPLDARRRRRAPSAATWPCCIGNRVELVDLLVGRAARRRLAHRRQLAPHRRRGGLHPRRLAARRSLFTDPEHEAVAARGRGAVPATRSRWWWPGPELDALAAAAGRRAVPARRARRRHDALHLGHHRPAQGREAHAAAEPRRRRWPWAAPPGMRARPRRRRARTSSPGRCTTPPRSASRPSTSPTAAELVLMPRWDESQCLQLIEERAVRNSHVVPTMCVRLLRLPDERAGRVRPVVAVAPCCTAPRRSRRRSSTR